MNDQFLNYKLTYVKLMNAQINIEVQASQEEIWQCATML